MSSSENRYDPIETLIFKNGLRIKGLHFYPEMDMMLVVLNNQKILKSQISASNLLKNASIEQLNNYEFIGKGVGVHWPELDEDLSLKGFLQKELVQQASVVA